MNKNIFLRFVYKVAINIIAIMVVSLLFKHVEVKEFQVALFAAIILTVLNVVLKPILVLISLPFLFLSLGIGYFIINAALLLLVSSLVPGFTIDGFWVAIGASLFISVINLVFDMFANTTVIKKQ